MPWVGWIGLLPGRATTSGLTWTFLSCPFLGPSFTGVSPRFGISGEQEEDFLFHCLFSLAAVKEFLLQSPMKLGGIRGRDSSSLALKFETENAGDVSWVSLEELALQGEPRE